MKQLKPKRDTKTGRYLKGTVLNTEGYEKSYGVKEEHSEKIGIYTIRNIINNKVYVGSTCESFEKRWRRHRGDLLKGYHGNPHLQSSWIKYGEKSFRFEVLEICDKSKDRKYVEDREQYYIDKLITPQHDYNIVMLVQRQLHRCKFDKKTCQSIIDEYLTTEITIPLIAIKHKTTTVTISKILNNRYYNFNPSKEELVLIKKKGKEIVLKTSQASNTANRSVTEEQAIFIYKNYGKYLNTELAEMFNTNKSTIADIGKGRTYKDWTQA